MTRVAIIGIGGYGAHLIDGLLAAAQRGRCQIVAAADANPAAHRTPAAAKLAAAQTVLYADAIEMLDAIGGRCQAVYICTGIASHAALAVATAQRGFHAHLEKPPAATIQEVDQMIAAFRQAGRMCLVGFQNLHGAELLGLREDLASGVIGKVLRISCASNWPRPRKYYDRNNWAGRLRCGDSWVLDGPATNALAHQIAHALALAEPGTTGLATPAAVRAELYAAREIDGHDLAAVEIRTTGGVEIRLMFSHIGQARLEPFLEVVTENGRAYLQPGEHSVLFLPDASEPWHNRRAYSREIMIDNLLDAVEAGRPDLLRCSLEDSRKFVAALDGAHESSGRIHRLPPEAFRREAPGTVADRIVVPGLNALLIDAAERHCLLSDLPNAPSWTVRTQPFDVTHYTTFPQRFRAE